jgi:TPR repeat protein
MTSLELGLAAFKARDYDRTLALLEPIAQSGHAEAQCILGNLYQLGLGVRQNLPEATKWYQQSSEQGYGVATKNLAEIIRSSDPAEADRLFDLARRQGFEHTRIR